MEDPGEEWEYEKFNDSPVESRKSSLSWLWSNGLWLGQKVLVTSFVISCAPLVLPPLLVVSALGFAVSVPAGIAIASYTCAEKLMNKLLPDAASRSTVSEEEDGSVEQNQQVGVAEKDQEVVSADMCFNSTADIGEIEENEVSPAASFDKKYYAEDAGEYNGVVKVESHEIDNPTIEDFGEEEVKEQTKETNSPIEVKDSQTLVQEEPEKESPKKATNSLIEMKDFGTSVQEDPKKESPKKETNYPIEVKDVESLVQEDTKEEDTKEEPTNKETDSPIEVKDFGTLVQEDTKEETTKKETDLPIEVKDPWTLVQEEPPKKEIILPIEVKNVETLVQEDTKSADTNDTKKLSVPVMVSREAQGRAGKVAEVKIPEETTGVLKNTRDGGISHERSKKNKNKIKSSGLKTLHVVEGKKNHKTVPSTRETGKSLEVGDEKLNMVDPNGLKADHIGVKGENTTVQVENLIQTVEMKKSVILESIVVEDRSTTMGDDKPIRYQSVSVIPNQAGEDCHNVDENVKSGMGNKRTMKEIRIEDSAADDNFDKQKTIPASTKAKGTTGNVNVDKRRAGSVTGVPKDPVEKGFKTSKQDSGVHKALLNEKRLWDQVDALRLIVGYKAARQPSLIEELKVLYAFTGVELPSSFQDSDDIRGTEDKLHFLMSTVGVK